MSGIVERGWEVYYCEPLSLASFHKAVGGQLHHMHVALGLKLGGASILEVGAANAYLGMYLASVGASYTGLDIVHGLLARARAWAPSQSNFDLVQGDLFRLPFGSKTFDLVYSQGVLEHFSADRIRDALAESFRVGEQVVLAVPTIHWKGGVRGDENLWSVGEWFGIVRPFQVVAVSGQAHRNLPGRLAGLLTRRFMVQERTIASKAIHRLLVYLRPGELCMVLRQRNETSGKGI